MHEDELRFAEEGAHGGGVDDVFQGGLAGVETQHADIAVEVRGEQAVDDALETDVAIAENQRNHGRGLRLEDILGV